LSEYCYDKDSLSLSVLFIESYSVFDLKKVLLSCKCRKLFLIFLYYYNTSRKLNFAKIVFYLKYHLNHCRWPFVVVKSEKIGSSI